MKKTAYTENLTSSKRMNRRTFLKSTAALGIGGLASSIPQQAWAEEQTINTAKNQTFKFKNGKFKVLQLTDTHYLTGDPRSERALKNVREMLDLEKPDLVIHTGDIIFGKPADRDEAVRMLSLLSGHTHVVATGVAIFAGSEKKTFTEETRVEFYELDGYQKKLIEDYIDTGSPFDKAGGYGIQDMGALLVKGISGDYANVVGFPVSRLARELSNMVK